MQHPLVDARKRAERHEDESRRQKSRRVVATADGKADARDDPEAGGRRQTRDRQPLLHDRARTQEADAGDDLRRKACRIGVRPALDALVDRRRDEHDEARAKAHEHVRAKPRRLAARLPLVADDAAENARKRQPHEYFPFGYHRASFQDGYLPDLSPDLSTLCINPVEKSPISQENQQSAALCRTYPQDCGQCG